MDDQKLYSLNALINQAYECASFIDFLKLSVLHLHEFVIYDSGLFFCAISQDSSYFKPYLSGSIEDYYRKRHFESRGHYLNESEKLQKESEPFVYTSSDFLAGKVNVPDEPRRQFLCEMQNFHIVCIRINYKGRFLGEIYLHRSIDKHPFSTEELFILRLLQPHISTVFNVIHTLSAVRETESFSQTKYGLCMLDGEMSIIGGNVTGIEMLKLPTVFGSSLLFHVKEICADSTDKNIHQSTIMNTKQGNVKIGIFSENQNSEKQFIVVMKFCEQNEPGIDYKLKFSRREAEIIDALIQGKNNQQIAKTINLSQNTIKTHIQNIYKKTGVNNRTELTYLLMLNT